MKKYKQLINIYEQCYYDKVALKRFLEDNPDFRVPCYYDNCFKKLFSYKHFLSLFLSHFINLSKEQIYNELVEKNPEVERINIRHKGSITDIKVELNDYVIIIESNKNKRKAIVEKNYNTFRGTSYQSVKKGYGLNPEDYKHCILISIDNYDYYKQNKVESKGKYLDVETHINLIEKESIYYINLEKISKEIYNINNLTNISTFNRLLMYIVSVSKNEATKIIKSLESEVGEMYVDLEKMNDEMNRYLSYDDEVIASADELFQKAILMKILLVNVKN